MSYDETLELFSEETLESMMMMGIVGGVRTFAANNSCMDLNFFCDGCGANIQTCNSGCKI